MSNPFTATNYTNLNIVQNGNFKEYSLQLLNSGNISFNTDISLNFTLVGGGGGGGGGGHNNGSGSPAYPSGGGGGGGGVGTYKINLTGGDSHIYYVGAGGVGGKANLGGQTGKTSYIDFKGSNILDRVDASGGNPGLGHYSGNVAGAYVESPTIAGLDLIKIVDSSGAAGGNGVSISNIGVGGNGTAGSSNNITSYNIDYTNTTHLGSGGGGADAIDTTKPPLTAGNGGGGGNGSTGGAIGTGLDNTSSPNGGTGKNGNVPGAGGGGGGQPGTNSITDGGYTPKITFGGNGADGAIYIWFKIESPPAPPPPIPPPISNRPGPIQYCTSRFARCNITKKTSFSSGNVTIQGTTNARRQSLIVNQSTYRHGAKLLFSNQVLNSYGRKAGGPGGFGASPRNQF